MTNQVDPERLAAFDRKAAAAKAAAAISYNSLLQLEQFSPDKQEVAAREFRLRGIDTLIKELKLKLPEEEVRALNHYLKQCPRIDDLAVHIFEYKESQELLEQYIPKLHTKIAKLK